MEKYKFWSFKFRYQIILLIKSRFFNQIFMNQYNWLVFFFIFLLFFFDLLLDAFFSIFHPNHYIAPLIHLLLIIIIDVKFFVQYFMFILAIASLQCRMCLLIGFTSFFDQGPEGSVIQVVDMTVHLAPTQICLQVLKWRVEHNASVERGDADGFWTKDGLEIEGVSAAEEREDAGKDFVFSPVKYFCRFSKHKWIFVRLAVWDHNIRKIFHNFLGAIEEAFQTHNYST